MAALVFAVFVFSRSYIGLPLHVWSDGDLSILVHLNALSITSLMAFIALRYAGIAREAGP